VVDLSPIEPAAPGGIEQVALDQEVFEGPDRRRRGRADRRGLDWQWSSNPGPPEAPMVK
jgi:hypothetical protein